MATWIKICGLTRLRDARQVVRLGANALGFVFHAASPRCCDPRRVREITRRLPPQVPTVGVWLDEDDEVIDRQARQAGVQGVQTYLPAVARRLLARGWRVILAVDPARDGWADDVRSAPAERVILDCGRSSGRAGVVVLTAAGVAALRRRTPVVLAGGLTPDNVAAMLRGFRPDGVDVASGVELAPGIKDAGRLERFITEVRQWDATVISGASVDASSPRR